MDRTYHHGVNILGIFPRGFTACSNFLLPRQRTLSHPIALGLIVPDVTPKITHALVHLKSVTLAEIFSSLDITRMYNQYAFGRLGMISASQTLAC